MFARLLLPIKRQKLDILIYKPANSSNIDPIGIGIVLFIRIESVAV